MTFSRQHGQFANLVFLLAHFFLCLRVEIENIIIVSKRYVLFELTIRN
jgi:hypothetical protein